MLSLTGESAESFAPAVKTLRAFVQKIPPRLITKTAKKSAPSEPPHSSDFWTPCKLRRSTERRCSEGRS
jgi:hypothetical protein